MSGAYGNPGSGNPWEGAAAAAKAAAEKEAPSSIVSKHRFRKRLDSLLDLFANLAGLGVPLFISRRVEFLPPSEVRQLTIGRHAMPFPSGVHVGAFPGWNENRSRSESLRRSPV